VREREPKKHTKGVLGSLVHCPCGREQVL